MSLSGSCNIDGGRHESLPDGEVIFLHSYSVAAKGIVQLSPTDFTRDSGLLPEVCVSTL